MFTNEMIKNRISSRHYKKKFMFLFDVSSKKSEQYRASKVDNYVCKYCAQGGYILFVPAVCFINSI